MSKVWRRLQRVGKTAYKFEFTIKVHTVTLECGSGWTPNQVSVLWVRRGRKVRTKATTWNTLPGKHTQGVVHWQALEATLTLYMDTNSSKNVFDDKYWTLIVENVGVNGRHKALATKRINMAHFADPKLYPRETQQKYRMKTVARKVHLTELQVTFISKFEKQGPAIDDDMRSVTSEMSELTLGGFEDGYMSETEMEPYNNAEDNEDIMREIAAIGADFRQLSNYADGNVNSGFPAGDSQEEILINWAREETKEFDNISISDMSDSWGDGVAFCAIINKHCPNLVKISHRDPYTNVVQASKASAKLGLMPTLDPVDFHKGRFDKLSIVTFVDQLYNLFKDDEGQVYGLLLEKEPEQPKARRVLSARKPDLTEDDEAKRRHAMIERGRLRASRRRPNRDKSNNSTLSRQKEEKENTSGLNNVPSNDSIRDIIPNKVECSVRSSLEADVFVTSSDVTSSDVFVTSSDDHLKESVFTLDPEELLRQFMTDTTKDSIKDSIKDPSPSPSSESVLSADEIIRALETEVIKSPSSVRISGISTEADDSTIDPASLTLKLTECKSEVELFKEALFSDQDIEKVPEKADSFVDSDENKENSMDELIKIKFSIDQKVEDEVIKPVEKNDTNDTNVTDDIEAEIAELEEQLNSSFLFKPKQQSPAEESPKKLAEEAPKKLAEEAPKKLEEDLPKAAVEVIPDEVEPLPEPSPLPPQVSKGSSLRDKIRGLHSAREKLMAAVPTVQEEDRPASLEQPASLEATPGELAPKQRIPEEPAPKESGPDRPTSPGEIVLPSLEVVERKMKEQVKEESPEPVVVEDVVPEEAVRPQDALGPLNSIISEDVALSEGTPEVQVVEDDPIQEAEVDDVIITERDITDPPSPSSTFTESSISQCQSCKAAPAPSLPSTSKPAKNIQSSKPAKNIQSLEELISSFSADPEPEEEDVEESRCLSGSDTDEAPPPPPQPEPLAIMVDNISEEELEVEVVGVRAESDLLNESTLDRQNLQDVRAYINTWHDVISLRYTKLDKKAKVLEKELRVAMETKNHDREQTLLRSWLHLVHERNTLVRKQDELNSLQNEDNLDERCCGTFKELRKYQRMRESEKTVADIEREEQLEEEYKELLKKREMLLRIRDDINTISLEEEAEFQSVMERPKLLEDQSSCRVS